MQPFSSYACISFSVLAACPSKDGADKWSRPWTHSAEQGYKNTHPSRMTGDPCRLRPIHDLMAQHYRSTTLHAGSEILRDHTGFM
jgi:hypothetical protein